MTSPDFPYLTESEMYPFPSPDTSTEEGVVGIGGNLSPGMLLSAYRQGIFPWYSGDQPILWWSPDPRFVLFPDELHVSKSMKCFLRQNPFTYSFDRFFAKVIRECARADRPGQEGTWITEEMISGYTKLHDLGYAHSVEVLENGHLVGGMYGVSLGTLFFGESMFSSVSNASKAALFVLIQFSAKLGLSLLDCQVYTDHLASMGARSVPRSAFLTLLEEGLEARTYKGSWTKLIGNAERSIQRS